MSRMLQWILSVAVSMLVVSPAFAQQATPSLDELIAEIKKQEEQYQNLQAKWVLTQELVSPVSPPGSPILNSHTTGTYTVDGEKFRQDESSGWTTLSANEVRGVRGEHQCTSEKHYAFDGEKTRSITKMLLLPEKLTRSSGSVGGKHDFLDGLITPHGTLLGLDKHPGGLSYWLDRWKQDPNFSVTIEGFEDKNDEPCIKVMVRQFQPEVPPVQDSSVVIASWKIWLSINRNYLDVACERYDHSYSLSIPAMSGEVYEFRELENGVFSPELVIVETNDLEIARQERRRLVEYRKTFQLKQCSFNPDLPENFYSDIEFPQGTRMRQLNEQAEPVRVYIQGEGE